MKAVCFWLLAFALVVVAGAQTKPTASKPTASAKRSAAAVGHPKVAAGRDCSECHSQATAAWDSSPHGKNLVKCLVCHGSLEEGFMAKPPASRCEGCHGRQVEQLKADRFMKGKTCFTCHRPHALKAHQPTTSGGEP